MTNPLGANKGKDIGAGRYPTAEEVDDFHRNSDLNQRYDSQHHTLGPGQYNASPGNHVHDGSTGRALLEEDRLTGVLSNNVQLPFIVKDLITILSDRFGLVDDTTVV